jgi:diguanylate cyclase (GGDEF)-like protein/PAS domain S-box-containing protein
MTPGQPRTGDPVLEASRELTRMELGDSLAEFKPVNILDGWFRHAFVHASIGMALIDLEGRYRAVNDELCRLLGRAPTDLIGHLTAEMLHPDDVSASTDALADILGAATDGLSAHRREKRYLRPDGEVVHAIRLARLVRDADGRPAFIYAQIVDVTDRQARYNGLAALGEQALSERTDTDVGTQAVTLVSSLLALEQLDAVAALKHEEPVWSGLSDEDRSFVRSVRHVVDAAQARVHAEDQSWRLAMLDNLTGLANRALLSERLEMALARISSGRDCVCVLMLDIDGFKRINDSLGHVQGDVLLRAVAHRLTAALRPEDTIARLGGDEFAVLLARLGGRDEAEAVAGRLLDALKAPFSSGGRSVHLSASVGIAEARSRSVGVEELLADADLAMYEAKTAGKSRFTVFEPNFRKAASGRLALEEDLRHAVEGGLFRLDFQPVVDLATGSWAGTEALIRWPHPTRGLVPPLDFITLAEETGLIVPLGRWVLDTALEHRNSWSGLVPAGLEFSLAVNVSVRQLVEPDFVHHVATAITDSGLPPASVTLEMTESVFMDDGRANARVLSKLHDLGLKIAIDDFGTGYSSLSYLRRFPIDVIKVDRSFVAGLLESREDRAVTKAMIELAHSLDLDLIAEGIETAEQLALLRELGCRLGQGYLLHRPMAVDAIVERYPASR